jgi:flagellin
MRINTNVSSLTAQESSTRTNDALRQSLEKLSSGLKINKAADDASGLAIADKLRTQATSINQAVDNGNSAVSLLQIADKSMAEQSNILDTVKAKLIQANTDTTSSAGRDAIAADVKKLLEQLDNIAEQTNYNGNTLLQASSTDVSSTGSLSFQIGETAADLINVGGVQSNSTGLGSLLAVVNAVSDEKISDMSDGSGGSLGVLQDKVDEAITQLNQFRAEIGSTQNQIESAVTNLMTQATNVKAAESIIRDVDYAAESANFNKLNIISQAGSYAISQSNQVQQNVLRLLQ